MRNIEKQIIMTVLAHITPGLGDSSGVPIAEQKSFLRVVMPAENASMVASKADTFKCRRNVAALESVELYCFLERKSSSFNCISLSISSFN
mmetsp:Transcript_44283/g.115063  ORF Transcript_44283/g.115063 Transcript_44283/m.115063 type:complete len:91 (-) Transcript_44283:798-1070(-)